MKKFISFLHYILTEMNGIEMVGQTPYVSLIFETYGAWPAL